MLLHEPTVLHFVYAGPQIPSACIIYFSICSNVNLGFNWLLSSFLFLDPQFG